MRLLRPRRRPAELTCTRSSTVIVIRSSGSSSSGRRKSSTCWMQDPAWLHVCLAALTAGGTILISHCSTPSGLCSSELLGWNRLVPTDGNRSVRTTLVSARRSGFCRDLIRGGIIGGVPHSKPRLEMLVFANLDHTALSGRRNVAATASGGNQRRHQKKMKALAPKSTAGILFCACLVFSFSADAFDLNDT